MKTLITIFSLFISFSINAQSITMAPGGQSSSKSSQDLDGSLTVAGDVISTKRGFTHPDGSVQLTAASNPNLPFSAYTSIYAVFENPDFDGDVTTTGHEGKVALVAANMDVEKVNLRTNNEKYRPILLKKGFDSASPYLFEAFRNNTALHDVTIEFWRDDNLGSHELKFKYTLTNAFVVSILHLDNKSEDGTFLPLEMVRLAFEELEIEDVEHGKTVVLQNL